MVQVNTYPLEKFQIRFQSYYLSISVRPKLNFIHMVKLVLTMAKNPAYGYWTEEDTNWSAKDTARMDELRKGNPEFIPTDFKDIKDLHESLLSDENLSENH